MKKTLLCAAVLPLVAACASGPETRASPSNSTVREDREFTTGSNIPRRNRMGGDGVTIVSPEELERARSGAGQGSASSGGGTQ